MMQMFYCPKCSDMRMLSNHSKLKGRDICPVCKGGYILADITYMEWIDLDVSEREKCIKAYAKAYPYDGQ